MKSEIVFRFKAALPKSDMLLLVSSTITFLERSAYKDKSLMAIQILVERV
jgi:hypothetical protein